MMKKENIKIRGERRKMLIIKKQTISMKPKSSFFRSLNYSLKKFYFIFSLCVSQFFTFREKEEEKRMKKMLDNDDKTESLL